MPLFAAPMRRKRRKRRRRDSLASMPDAYRHRPRILELPAGPDAPVDKSFSPVQPRWPAGHSNGGKWRPAGVGIPDGTPRLERPTLFDILDDPPDEPTPVTKRPAILGEPSPQPPVTERPAWLDTLDKREPNSTPRPAVLESTGVQPVDTSPLTDAADVLHKLAGLVADADISELPAAGDVARVVGHAQDAATGWVDRYRAGLELPQRPAVLGPAPEVAKFDPRQPRAPKGAASGGQWVAGSAVSGGKGPMRGPGGGGGGTGTDTAVGPLLQRQIDRLDGWTPGDTHVHNKHGAVVPADDLNYIVREAAKSGDDWGDAEDFKTYSKPAHRAKPVTSPMSRNEGEQIVSSIYDTEDGWWKDFSVKPPFTGLPKLGDRASGRATVEGENKTWTGRVVGYDRTSATGNAFVYIETDHRDAGGWRRTTVIPAERQVSDDDE